MNRNQKIAIGCGAAGCLGLIVVTVAACILFLFYRSSATSSNRSGNRNAGASRTPAQNSNTTNSERSNPSSMSDDDKHKLFQAAGGTQDSELMQRVLRKLNFIREDGSATDEYAVFLKDHLSWALKNVHFIQTINTPEKARAYVEAHIND